MRNTDHVWGDGGEDLAEMGVVLEGLRHGRVDVMVGVVAHGELDVDVAKGRVMSGGRGRGPGLLSSGPPGLDVEI